MNGVLATDAPQREVVALVTTNRDYRVRARRFLSAIEEVGEA